MQQPDPWNFTDEDVVDVLQQIWDIIYKNIPYVVEQKDAVFAAVHVILFGTHHDTYGSDRQCSMPVTCGTLHLVLWLSLSLILSMKIVMMTF